MYTYGIAADHVGWVRLTTPITACSRGGSCRTYATGYRWTGLGWQSILVPNGPLYVTPYASGWRWAYNASIGWVALSTNVPLMRY